MRMELRNPALVGTAHNSPQSNRSLKEQCTAADASFFGHDHSTKDPSEGRVHGATLYADACLQPKVRRPSALSQQLQDEARSRRSSSCSLSSEAQDQLSSLSCLSPMRRSLVKGHTMGGRSMAATSSDSAAAAAAAEYSTAPEECLEHERRGPFDQNFSSSLDSMDGAHTVMSARSWGPSEGSSGLLFVGGLSGSLRNCMVLEQEADRCSSPVN